MLAIHLLPAVILLAAAGVNEKFALHLNGAVELEEAALKEMYLQFSTEFQKPADFGKRFDIFKDTVKRIAEHNSNPDRSWSMGIGKFSDITDEEFFEKYGLNADQDCSATEHNILLLPKYEDYPTNYDWREQKDNPVTPVKNQGKCGSCWTFSTTGAMESHWCLYHNKTVVSLAEQQLVDCAQDFDNHGCNGGLPSHAFEYINHVGGIEGEQTYPYKAQDGVCNFEKSRTIADTQGSVNITRGDEVELRNALHDKGPISVSFEVMSGFKDYKSGVYTHDDCGTTT